MKTPIHRYRKTGAEQAEGSMKYGIAWNDSYKLGNDKVDEQHRTLFELVGSLAYACMEGREAETLMRTLDFLVNYTVQHFNDEEQLQIQFDFPDYERHKQLHEDFKLTVAGLVQRYKESASAEDLSNDVNRIVARWLVNHIQREDKKIGEHIRSVSSQ